MFYPLSSVHALIYETIHPETLSERDKAIYPEDTWKQVKREIENSRLHLFSQLSQASGSDSLKVIIYTCQAGYLSLIKRLSIYIRQGKADADQDVIKASLCNQYREIRKLLVGHLLELYNQYFPFFDFEQPVPRFVLHNKSYNINTQLMNVREQLQAFTDSSLPVSIICFPFDQLFAPEQPEITFKQFHYLKQLLTELNRYCFVAKPLGDLLSLTDLLIRRNFNEPVFINHIVGKIREQITDEMTLQEQAEKWAFHVKEFNQITLVTSQALYPQKPSVKESLITAAEQELFFLRQRIALSPVKKNISLQDYKETKSIATELTVSQLGVFMRLLVDCKVIQHPNQTELLKLAAGCLTTTKTAQISAESLRMRYYKPDRASLVITKEYLLQMLKQLNQY